MYLQVCDKICRDLISSSSPAANKSMMYSKISSGSVSESVSMIEMKCNFVDYKE